MDQTQEFLTMLLKALVDNPDAVEVVRTVDEMGVLMTVKVSPEDTKAKTMLTQVQSAMK